MCILILVLVQAVFSKSNFRALLSNVSMRSSSNVSKYVDGLRHLTKKFSANFILLSVSWGRSKFARSGMFSQMRMALRAANFVAILLVISQPVKA